MHSIEAIQYISMNNNYVIYTSLIEGKYTVNSLSLKTKEKKVLFSSNKVIKIISYINKNNNFIFEKKIMKLAIYICIKMVTFKI